MENVENSCIYVKTAAAQGLSDSRFKSIKKCARGEWPESTHMYVRVAEMLFQPASVPKKSSSRTKYLPKSSRKSLVLLVENAAPYLFKL